MDLEKDLLSPRPLNKDADSDHKNRTSADPAADDQSKMDHPVHWPLLTRCAIVLAYCILEIFILSQQPLYRDGKPLVARKFSITSTQILTLGESLNIVGNTIGVAYLGPLSYVQ